MKQTNGSARRRLAALYVGAGLVLVAAMGVVTSIVLRQHEAQARATSEALFHEDLRTAMWRMETRVGTMIATTTNRVPEPNAWIDPKANMVNSLGSTAFVGNPDLNDQVVEAADQAFVMACEINASEESPVIEPGADLAQADPGSYAQPQSYQTVEQRGSSRSQQEFLNRYGANQQLQISNVNGADGIEFTTCVGPLAPVWSEGDAGLDLYLARRVEAPEGVRHESYRVAWAALRDELLGEIEDLFPDAALEPIVDETDVRPFDPTRVPPTEDDAVRLAAIPARLVVDPPVVVAGSPMGLVLSLGGAWSALLLALVFGGVALRASFAYGDKHRRFTHAVTHELRTPLTTFRMYSEMLSRGMVPEDARAEYLATLESESTRLAGLVENVLRYARLEEGRSAPSLETLRVSSLVERCVPELARICGQTGGTLEVRDASDDDPTLTTDGAAVHQVLANLVENACKYGRASEDRPARVLLVTSNDGQTAMFDVVDDGPGIDPAKRRAIFEPFERAGRDSSDPSPGVGLGLALSRELAMELGGDLTLVPTERGATFRLTLPRQSMRST